MRTTLQLVVLLFVGGAVSTAQNATMQKLPAQVIGEYCHLDMQGARLSSNNPYTDRIFSLVEWEDEPGWDGAEIVKGCRIVSAAVGDQKATVTMEYQVLGSSDEYTIHPNKHLEKVTFNLIKSKARWRILKPVIAPHVAPSSLIANFQDLLKKQNDLEIRNQCERAIAELQAMEQ